MILPGHRVSTLHVLDFGLFDVGPGKRTIGIPGFLITTDNGARILIDTGFPADYATAPEATALRDGLPRFGRLMDFTPRQTLTGQLATLGLTPADITLTVLTHGHIDHVGGLPLLTCPLVLTSAERATDRPLYFGESRPINWPDVRTHRIDTETAICDGLTLIPTPGHTPGHLSVMVTLPNQTVLLAADAINRATEPDEGYPDAMDPATAATSGAQLIARATALGATLIYGHDPGQWPRLAKAPHPFALA